MPDHGRQIDRWMRWMAFIGPMVGVILGVMIKASIAYQLLQIDTTRLDKLESWKVQQEEFNQKTVSAISRLKALMKEPD